VRVAQHLPYLGHQRIHRHTNKYRAATTGSCAQYSADAGALRIAPDLIPVRNRAKRATAAAAILLVACEVSITPSLKPGLFIIRRVKTSWLRANGGPVTLVGILLAVGFPLLGLRGVPHLFGWISLAGALLVFLLSIEWIQEQIPWKVISRKELTADFWEQAFEALPFPAFVKEFPEDVHVKDSDSLKTFQGEKPTEELVESDLAARIQQDHRQGDEIAARAGRSVQLELTDKVLTWEPRAILTLKSRVKYGKRKFVVGCYVPVRLPSRSDLSSADSLKVAECGGQIVFPCPSTADGENHILVMIGKSLQVQQPESAE
jgi:hypothetical protein